MTTKMIDNVFISFKVVRFYKFAKGNFILIYALGFLHTIK